MSGAQIAGYGWKYSGEALSAVFQTTFVQYRPGNAGSPLFTPALSPSNQIAAALAGFVSTLSNAQRHVGPSGAPIPWDAPDPAKPRWAGFFDPAALALGDYLVGPLMQGGNPETMYVSQIAAPSPPVVVRCNAVTDLSRGVIPTVFGAQPPLDTQAGTETPLAQGWPGSVLREGRGQEGDTKLPSDVKLGGYLVLLPPNIPISLRSGDTLTITAWVDDPLAAYGVRLEVAMAESTPDGWKLLCQEVMT